MNDSFDFTHILWGWIYLFRRQHDEAIKEGERAIELNPNGALAHAHLAFTLICSDKIESAIKLIKRAIRLNPFPQADLYVILAAAYRYNEQYEKAIEVSEKILSVNPDLLAPYLTLAISYTFLNRTEDAREAIEEVLRIQPEFSAKFWRNTLPFKNQEKLDKLINALRKAGLPE